MRDIKDDIEFFAKSEYQKELNRLEPYQLHNVVSKAIMSEIADRWRESKDGDDQKRRAYYLSAEFLVGRAIYNNMLCMGLYDRVRDALAAGGADINDLEAAEDAALGNGGLGRLAACFLDSAATLGLPLDGYGIRYRFGLFRQTFEKGFQKENIDDWSKYGDPWSVRRDDAQVVVSFADGDVRAVPYDMPVIGYGLGHVSTLRLWQCEPMEEFSFELFNEQSYDASVEQKNRAEDISRVLYPNDSGEAGKLLRLKQQYFFSSASLQDIVRRYRKRYGSDYSHFAELNTVQLNDTHPTVAIPELIRLLTEDGAGFDEALEIAKRAFNYTNHTIMQEALEKHSLELVEKVSPEIADIIVRINDSFSKELAERGVDGAILPQLLIVQEGTVHMAYLACFVSTYINGVAQLHTEILKEDVLREWFRLYPEKFQNKTNGVTQRRWLALCNFGLSVQITELLGSEAWKTDLGRLQELRRFADDRGVLERFVSGKRENKRVLCGYMERRDGKTFDLDSIVDVQVKRLHEYKRQLLNILCILELYFEIKEGSLTDFTPTTFIFGAKAAPGYARAKSIIKLINEVAELVDADPEVSRVMKVIFVSEYNVSYGEKIFAATDVSEQLSTAGTEASGTGNMKMMMNGAVTLGTFDGANIEIFKEAGEENNYVFGALVDELEALESGSGGQSGCGGYDPRSLYEGDFRIKRCLDALTDGTLSDEGTGMFAELKSSLLDGASWHAPDHYYVLLDFADCLEKKLQINRDYKDRYGFARKQWLNMCGSGKFSSDRTVAEYAKDIWRIV